MSVAGDCLEIPTYIDSIGECTGEYLGLEEQESAYAQLQIGLCRDPIFEIVES